MMNNPYRPGGAYGGYPGYPAQQGGMQYGGQMSPPPASGQFISPTGQVAPTSMLPIEQSFIENILRLNLGKMATLYMTYENNSEWNAKIFKGRLEAAGRDHIIISDPTTGMRYLLLMVNLDYITFNEELKYAYPYGQQPPLTTR
ncbi:MULTISPECIES: spore coat protein GerQ [Paenibacillus]|uniref:Spore coat protein GerQ n=1 Tax=Paenibacillus radicis (ex Xue et al. 2023) TaxID=2972489 RepID=A0ABT1YDA4_9BACL|nr:spore coat protein GerQ [Paenibacillus radicis (ex Xue et al. 2023)]MCR8629940.1 spore coat protein GerQ [Paenibacillus radicis (ex Xue et al. 2023)]